MSCCETSTYVKDCGFFVCVGCGNTKRVPVFIMPSVFSRIPTRPPYSRKKRFMKLLHNCWGARLPRMCNAFVKLVVKSKPSSVQEIIRFIKNLKNRVYKRYDCVSRLAHDILGHSLVPMSRTKLKVCEGIFRRIEIKHRLLRTTFPAYSFIIEHCFLHTHIQRPDLVQYLHLLKCPRRRAQYYEDYSSCFYVPMTKQNKNIIHNFDQNPSHTALH